MFCFCIYYSKIDEKEKFMDCFNYIENKLDEMKNLNKTEVKNFNSVQIEIFESKYISDFLLDLKSEDCEVYNFYRKMFFEILGNNTMKKNLMHSSYIQILNEIDK